MTDQTMSGACEGCGTTVERERLTGIGAPLNQLRFRCTACEAEIIAAQELEDRDAEARQRTERAHRRIADQLPFTLRAVDLDKIDTGGCANAIAAARDWAANGGGLLLTGPFGVGKTTIAAGALRARLLTGHIGHWTSTPLIMARLGSGFGTPQREAAVSVLTGRGALVLDDLDKTRPTDYGAEQIFLAVDGAVTSGRPLLVTTNLTGGELAARWPEPYGEAIASRLSGYCTAVRVTGPDRRLHQTQGVTT
jgi:DNA replication protein DnaC